MHRACLAIALFLAALPARAQWTPEWIGTWEHPEPFRAILPVAVLPMAGGSVLALADVTHHNTAHATLVRFEADGSFAWLRERSAFEVADALLLAGGRVAVVGSDSAVFARVIDATSGDTVHECSWTGAQLGHDERDRTRTVAQAPDESLLVRARVGGDLVIFRCDALGQVLPEWRWRSGLTAIQPDDLVALPDGGAIATARGSVGEGYFTLHFDAAGTSTVLDGELGEIGNPLGAAHVAVDAAGDVLIAAAPESTFGVPQAQAWKVAPDGTRLWTRVVEIEGVAHPNLDIGGFALAADGDLVIAAAPPAGPFRVLRLAGGDGSTRWDSTAAIGDNPTDLALAADGRVLVGGYDAIPGSGGLVTGRIAEFDADGTPCRHATTLDIGSKVRASPGTGGWSVLGGTAFVQGVGNDLVVQRFDADGACEGEADQVFADGFEPAP
ncbi:MAG: hypothetical protein EOP90_09700 [Lysobacteraceae bacterium]|nr:MAG: hypothetical protein EOP90_09700 [Xanthomonadaceae bacterium]